jgi:hypothetical protein
MRTVLASVERIASAALRDEGDVFLKSAVSSKQVGGEHVTHP